MGLFAEVALYLFAFVGWGVTALFGFYLIDLKRSRRRIKDSLDEQKRTRFR